MADTKLDKMTLGSLNTRLGFCSPAYEWQGHNKPLHPVSMVVDEKERLQVYDRSGPALRSLSLSNQSYLDVFLSSDRQRKALLLKVPKEYDLVSTLKSSDSCLNMQQDERKTAFLHLV